MGFLTELLIWYSLELFSLKKKKKKEKNCSFVLFEHQAHFQLLQLEGHATAVVRACAQAPASLLRVSHCVYNSRRSGEKDIFTESRNVGQVGARGDPEQGQR